MANKMLNRSDIKKEQNEKTSNPRSYTDPNYMTRYGIEYAKRNYRTIGFKLNVRKEKDLIAYLDYQPELKAYLKKLIIEDMLNHPREAKRALLTYEEQEKMYQNNMNIRSGDIIMKCPNCGESTVVRRKTYYNAQKEVKCFNCDSCMIALNPPVEKEIRIRKEN